MTRADSVRKYNRDLRSAGLVGKLVENTDPGPVERFFKDVGAGGKHVLDVGCSSGLIAAELARNHAQWQSYTGIDLCDEFVDEFNSRKLPRASAVVGDATELMFDSSSKDIILCLFIHQHLTEDEGKTVLRELKRVAKPLGQVLVGITVNPERVELPKMHAAEVAVRAGVEKVPTYIWNKQVFLDAMTAAGYVKLQFEELPGTSPYVKLYARGEA